MAGRGFLLRLFVGEADPIPRRLNGISLGFSFLILRQLSPYTLKLSSKLALV